MTNAGFDLSEVLDHCIFAIGSGARMPITRSSIRVLRKHIEGSFAAELMTRPKDPLNPEDVDPGEPRWQAARLFLLACCETIGRLAAINATMRGSILIELADLKKAYNTVSARYGGAPGDFCPFLA